MVRNRVVVVAFNAKLSDGCDYATQTISLLGKQNAVYALLLGEPFTWKQILSGGWRSLITHSYNSVLIRPLYLVPGQRFPCVVRINIVCTALCIRIALFFRHPQMKKILWFFEPWNMVPVYQAFRRYTTVYDCVDYFAPLGYESWQNEAWLIPTR